MICKKKKPLSLLNANLVCLHNVKVTFICLGNCCKCVGDVGQQQGQFGSLSESPGEFRDVGSRGQRLMGLQRTPLASSPGRTPARGVLGNTALG